VSSLFFIFIFHRTLLLVEASIFSALMHKGVKDKVEHMHEKVQINLIQFSDCKSSQGDGSINDWK